MISAVTAMTGKPHTRDGAYKPPKQQPEATELFIDVETLIQEGSVVYGNIKKFRSRSDPRARLDLGKLCNEIRRGSKLFDGYIVAPDIPPADSFWERKGEFITHAEPPPVRDPGEPEGPRLRLLCGRYIHTEKHGSIILATTDPTYKGLIETALEKGLKVELWTFTRCSMIKDLAKHPQHQNRLNIFYLDDIIEEVLVVDDQFNPRAHTCKEVSARLQRSGAIMRVAAYLVDRKGFLKEDFRRELEAAAHWPILYYPLSPGLTEGETRDFLLIFASAKDDSLFDLSKFVEKVDQREVAIYGLEDVISCRRFQIMAPKRSSVLLKQIYSECKDDPSKKLIKDLKPTPKTAPTEDTRKERICKYHMRSSCWRGKRCPYAHGEDDAWCGRCQIRGHFKDSTKCSSKGCELMCIQKSSSYMSKYIDIIRITVLVEFPKRF